MWSIFEALEGRASERFSPEMQMGLLGAPQLIKSDISMHLSDLSLLVIPGLAAIGIDATVHLVDSVEALTTTIIPQAAPHPLFALDEAPTTPEESSEDAGTGEPLVDIDPIVIGQFVVMSQHNVDHNSLLWRTSPNSELTPQQPVCKAGGWALLTIKRASRSGLRSAVITAALLRWVAFADANPDRLIGSQNPEQTERAAAFISECAGSQSSPAATRLRRSAAAFQSGEVGEAIAYLRQSVLLRMGLTAALRNALSRPDTEPLTDTQRRELIYLARAGTAELKTLAVYRLASDANRDHPDVRATLQQMKYDGNTWVRAAAGTSRD